MLFLAPLLLLAAPEDLAQRLKEFAAVYAAVEREAADPVAVAATTAPASSPSFSP